MPIKLLIVDDHDVVRSGIRSLLEPQTNISEIREASNGHEAIMISRTFHPDVIIMDYEMPNFNGIYASKEIMKDMRNANILLLSMHQNSDLILEGVDAGVKGYLPKNAKFVELLMAVEELSRGGTWFRGSVAEILAPHLIHTVQTGKKQRKKPELTPRETEIVKLLAEGDNTIEIANKLSISKHTVEIHKTNINKKLNTRNVSDLTRYAIRNQLIGV